MICSTAPETIRLIKELAKPRRFLMIDDDPVFLDSFRMLSTDFNCWMDSAGSYTDGIQKCADQLNVYDFIWLDLMLNHGRRGFEVFEIIKKFDRFKPVVICSKTIPVYELEKCSKIGVGHFILKPVQLNDAFIEEVFTSFGICRNARTVVPDKSAI